jgi:glycine dehydrogenase
MLRAMGYASRAALIETVSRRPSAAATPMGDRGAAVEAEALARLRAMARKNRVFKSFIGQGLLRHAHARRHTAQRLREPRLVHRVHAVPAGNSQGRLEALLNFQTMVADLTGHGDRERVDARRGDRRGRGHDALPALDAARSRVFGVADDVLPQTIDVIRTRAAPLGIEVRIAPAAELEALDAFAVIVQ